MRILPFMVVFSLLLLPLPALSAQMQATKEFAAIEKMAQRIKEEYGVTVHYIYHREAYFPSRWLEPPANAQGQQIDATDAALALPAVETFLSAYPKVLISKHLHEIYLLGKLMMHGQEYGATYRENRIYVKTASTVQSDVLEKLHAEFSSLLFRAYPFPKDAWEAINPAGNYTGTGVEILRLGGDPFAYNDHIQEYGFLTRYSMSSIENDFNMYAVWHFTQPDTLIATAEKFERIAQKRALFIDFYEKLGISMHAPQD